jgi:hypothetical protein
MVGALHGSRLWLVGACGASMNRELQNETRQTCHIRLWHITSTACFADFSDISPGPKSAMRRSQLGERGRREAARGESISERLSLSVWARFLG